MKLELFNTVVLSMGWTIAWPGELLKDTDACAPNQNNEMKSLGGEAKRQNGLTLAGDSNMQPGLRTI